MFQKEVAQRITANPNDKAYGRLAILTQSICTVQIAFDVPARAFTPPPKVDSAVVVFDPLPIEKRFKHLKILGEVTMATFSQRRKMLRGSLKSITKKYGTTPLKLCELTEINPEFRPENLSIIDFQNLALNLKEKTNHL
jgi:16S rRNA (adenine1518-N6/adenine1519-N6)-dimethyltransferase